MDSNITNITTDYNLTSIIDPINSSANPTNNLTCGIPAGEDPSWVYTKGIPLMTIVCIISIFINVKVLASVHWIRRPLSATLYISLSLAAADAFTSLMFCLHFLLNSYLPCVLHITISDCQGLGIEAFRLGGIVTTVMHLTMLACNHYLGIVRPLHSHSIMTHGRTTICLIWLWVAPTAFFFAYFALEPQGFMAEDCPATFMYKLKFRIIFAPFLVVPLIIMTFIYTHILIIVKNQQKAWHKSAERGASCRHRGPTSTASTSIRRRNGHQMLHHHNQSHQREQRSHMARSIKAVYTTLLILGSFALGLLPAVVLFLLVCPDCLIFVAIPKELFWFANFLVMIKTLANPIIYGARMHEIKEAMRRMRENSCRRSEYGSCHSCHWCLCSDCCPIIGSGSLPNSSRTSGGGNTLVGGGNVGGGFGRRWDEGSESQQLYNSGASLRGAPRTVVCRLVCNGNTPNLATTMSAQTQGRLCNNTVLGSDNTVL